MEYLEYQGGMWNMEYGIPEYIFLSFPKLKFVRTQKEI